MDRWKQFAKRTFAIEQHYHPLFLKTSAAFRRSLIQHIRSNGIASTQNYLTAVHLELGVAPVLQSLYKRAGKVGARLSHNELKQAVKENKKGATHLLRTKAAFGLNEQWITAVLDYLKVNLLNLASAITETMRRDALRIISRGVEQGWSVDQMTQALADETLQATRARVIVRTEVNRAANVGHQIGAASIPYELNKKWVSARDHRTRHSHRSLNGHVVDEHGTFKVPVYQNDVLTGYDEMDGPGDPKASKENTINCRCRKVFEPKRDTQGNLIPRTGTPARIIPLRTTTYSGSPSQIAAALKKAITISID